MRMCGFKAGVGGGGEGGGRKSEVRAEIIAKTGIRIRTPFEYSAAITAQPQHVLVSTLCEHDDDARND